MAMPTFGVRCADLSSSGCHLMLASWGRSYSTNAAARLSGRRGAILESNWKSSLQMQNRLLKKQYYLGRLRVTNHSYCSDVEYSSPESDDKEKLGSIDESEGSLVKQQRFTQLEREIFVEVAGSIERRLSVHEECLERSPIVDVSNLEENCDQSTNGSEEGLGYREQRPTYDSVLENGSIGPRGDLSMDVRNQIHVTHDMLSSGDGNIIGEDRLIWNIVRLTNNLPQNSSLEYHLSPFREEINSKNANRVLRALEEDRLIWQSLSFFQWMRIQDPCLVDSQTFCNLFTHLGNQRMGEKALTYYQNMPEESSFHCVQVYNSLLGALSKSGRTEKMASILKEMEHRNIEQDAITCSILIATAQEKESTRLGTLWTVIDDNVRNGKRSDVILYESLIKAFCDEGYLKHAMLIFLSMEKAGILGNLIIYTSLIHAHTISSKFEEAEGLLLEMKEKGLNPSLATYNALIHGYGRNGQPDVSEELVLEMQKDGLEPDLVTYTSLITAYGKKQMSEKAVDTFIRMKKKGIVPTSHTYTALINAYAEGGWQEKAQRVFDNMMKEKLKPTAETYTALLGGYSRAGDLEAVRHLWATIKDDGCAMSRMTYHSIMDVFSKHGLCIEARDVIDTLKQRGLQPDTTFFNMLLISHAKCGETSKLPKLMMEMEEAGCEPDSVTYCTLIYACIRLQNFTLAFHYETLMMETGKLPDSPTFRKMRKILRGKHALKEENDKKADADNDSDPKGNISKVKNQKKLKRIRKEKGQGHVTEREKALWKQKPRATPRKSMMIQSPTPVSG